jgi:hypothetical protein
MITPQKARQDYVAAMTALDELISNPDITPQQRQSVRDSIREVTNTFIDQVQVEINALTAQYSEFIRFMTGLVADLQKGPTPVATLNKLTDLVDTGASLVKEVQEVADAAGARAFGRKGARAVRRAPGLAGSLKILCIHGVGHEEADPDFQAGWKMAIASGVMRWNPDRLIEVQFVNYDDLFAAAPLSIADTVQAVAKLGLSGIVHGIGDFFRRQRGFGDVRESLRWTAGMVVQWAENSRLRAAARRRITDALNNPDFQPDIILAHSLGTLLCYDTFARPEGQDLLVDRTFVTFGSQIGNAFVRSTLGGRICPLEKARRWYHLFNRHDDAFTAELRIHADNFEQVRTDFDISGILDHDATQYLTHRNTVDVVWRALVAPGGARSLSETDVALAKQSKVARRNRPPKPPRRALLVGINDYPNEADRLQGCVNDVFLMSSLLQEHGFDADNIRVLLNERATAAGILDRLAWLLEGTEDGQDRVFFYSGHGAQIPGYGIGETVDRKDECLVAYDFDWSREHAVTDDQFYDLYSQLPYNTSFLTIFDCCHSGGMTREGAARVRGLTPPDDIRHRELRWDKDEEMWVPRDFQKKHPLINDRQKHKTFFGDDGAVHRLGRAAALRQDDADFNKALKDFDHKGPFMPVIIQACEEKQYSYEYRHGVQSYGAFTYSLGLILREKSARKQPRTWAQLVESVAAKLEGLEYDQSPCLVCPSALRDQPLPWKKKK